jgi:hypothetical protein
MTKSMDTIPADVAAQLPCVICGHHGRGPAHPYHLTHGFSVWLCVPHSTTEFLQRRDGLEFVERIAVSWASGGRLTSRAQAALRAHVARIQFADAARDKPGSYSWPVLREKAEARFAAGEPPDIVIDSLRASHEGGTAVVPSVRTMRRWFSEARWLARPPRRRPMRTALRYPMADFHRPRHDPLVSFLLTGIAYPRQNHPRGPTRRRT